MITHVRIQNFRSFLDASVDLQPFSLVLGANGSGKTNFLRFFAQISTMENPRFWSTWRMHSAADPEDLPRRCTVLDDQEEAEIICEAEPTSGSAFRYLPRWSGDVFPLFNIDPVAVAGIEVATPYPEVKANGAGTCQVLESLKGGDREDLFDQVESNFQRYVPEVEKLSLAIVEKGKKQIQVREKGLGMPTPAPELSEGTRLILCILTILHQEKPPKVILLEDIDRGMHPRLFEHMAPLMRDIAERHGINIIATTHNPYLVDCFRDQPEAVILVEKKDGASTLTTLAERLKEIDYDSVDPDDAPLGQLWYSGLVGAVPLRAKKAEK